MGKRKEKGNDKAKGNPKDSNRIPQSSLSELSDKTSSQSQKDLLAIEPVQRFLSQTLEKAHSFGGFTTISATFGLLTLIAILLEFGFSLVSLGSGACIALALAFVVMILGWVTEIASTKRSKLAFGFITVLAAFILTVAALLIASTFFNEPLPIKDWIIARIAPISNPEKSGSTLLPTGRIPTAVKLKHVPAAMLLHANGKERFLTVNEYFHAANPILRNDLDKSIADALSGKVSHQLRHVTAPAGIGKSMFFNYFKDRLAQDTNLALIEINLEVFRKNPPVAVDATIELESNRSGIIGAPVSKMPKLADRSLLTSFERFVQLFDRSKHLSGSRPVFMVVDSLDEIHPDDQTILLNLMNSVITSRQNDTNGFLDITVIGRAEGFLGHYKEPTGRAKRGKLFSLNPPIYLNQSEWKVVARDTAQFNNLSANAVSAAFSLSIQHDFLWENVRSLAVMRSLIQHAEDWNNNGFNERAIKDGLVAAMMERNATSHGRPLSDDLAYRHLIENTAAMYADRVDENGYFLVNATELVQVDVRPPAGLTDYRVMEVLAFCGFVEIEPPDRANPRVRFFPRWLHQYFIETFNERVASVKSAP